MTTTLPDAPPAEDALLMAIYHQPAIYLDLDWLPATAFTSTPHSAVWAALGLVVTQQQTLDRANWETILRGDPTWPVVAPTWARIASAPDTFPAPAEYAATIAEGAQRRAIRRAAAELDALAQDPALSLDSLLAQAEDTILGVTGGVGPERGVTPLRTILDRIYSVLNSPDDAAPGLPTGLPDLDALIGGGRPGQFWVITAPTGSGKTTLTASIASAVADAGGVVYFASLEMTEDEVGQDALARAAGVDSSAIRDGVLDDVDLDRVVQAMGPLSEWAFYVDDSEHLTLRTITHRARRIKHRAGRLDLLVVDYVQLISPDNVRKGQTREQELNEIAAGLKRLAKRLHCWVIAPSQLTDDGKVRDSRAIQFHANVHVTIEADLDPKYLNAAHPVSAKLIVKKARGGGLGQVDTEWHLPTHQFRPAPRGLATRSR